ncbi:MAG: hypothetical protein GF398_00665 [Chitinivibrionales bacterium]|nr:hypothetical protein [Chitinivibrionales bacterium]
MLASRKNQTAATGKKLWSPGVNLTKTTAFSPLPGAIAHPLRKKLACWKISVYSIHGESSAMRKLLLPALVVTFFSGASGYGEPQNNNSDMPFWRERALFTLTNACRLDPQGFRETYIGSYSILLPANYGVVPPLYWHAGLNQAARIHASDMATDCGLSHNSCDGTAYSTRTCHYYDCSIPGVWTGENIAYGNSDPVRTMRQWIMDADRNGIPAPDKEPRGARWKSGDGHRKNIMNAQYFDIGTGYAYGKPQNYSNAQPFWVQDFGTATSQFSGYALPAASHIFPGSNKIRFLVCYYDDSRKKPQQAGIVIDGEVFKLHLHLGSEAQGTYLYETDESFRCRSYHFVFSDGDGTAWRYPEAGQLRTYGEGNCSQSYTGVVFKHKHSNAQARRTLISHMTRHANGTLRCFVACSCVGPPAIRLIAADGKVHDVVSTLRYRTAWEALIETAGVAPGVYFLQVRHASQSAAQQIIID